MKTYLNLKFRMIIDNEATPRQRKEVVDKIVNLLLEEGIVGDILETNAYVGQQKEG